MKVVKFGGSSMADAKQFEKVRRIIESDPARRFVVPQSQASTAAVRVGCRATAAASRSSQCAACTAHRAASRSSATVTARRTPTAAARSIAAATSAVASSPPTVAPSATRAACVPGAAGRSENPKPGMLGTTTSKSLGPSPVPRHAT